MKNITVRKTWFENNVLNAEVSIDVGGLQLYLTIYVSFDNEIRVISIDSNPLLDDCLACLAYLNTQSTTTIAIIRDQYRNR